MLPPIRLFENSPPIRYVLAPMAGITDIVFRSLMRQMGAQVVISELLSSEGLVRGGQKTRDLLKFCDEERPVGIQIFGSDIAVMTEAARIIQGEGADFVDINFGCPVKKVVCDGGGASWLKEPVQLGKLLESLKGALSIPLTIKIRTGWDEESRNTHEIVSIAAASGVHWVAIHGRTRAQGYAGSADWDWIREVSHGSSIPIIGNGDILEGAQARERIEQGYAHAVMIGRGALKNPWIFKEALEEPIENRDFTDLIEQHFSLAIERKDRLRAFLSLKKFMGWYAAGLPHASQFRSQIFSTSDVDELRALTLGYFGRNEVSLRSVDRQPFLMGGHG